jgi:hypothetical protein
MVSLLRTLFRTKKKVKVARVALMLRIRKVSGSNLDPETGYPHGGYLYLLQETVRLISQSTTLPLPSTSSALQHSLISLPLDILQSELMKVSLNEP